MRLDALYDICPQCLVAGQVRQCRHRGRALALEHDADLERRARRTTSGWYVFVLELRSPAGSGRHYYGTIQRWNDAGPVGAFADLTCTVTSECGTNMLAEEQRTHPSARSVQFPSSAAVEDAAVDWMRENAPGGWLYSYPDWVSDQNRPLYQPNPPLEGCNHDDGSDRVCVDGCPTKGGRSPPGSPRRGGRRLVSVGVAQVADGTGGPFPTTGGAARSST